MSVANLLLGAAGQRKYESATIELNGQPLTVWFKSLTGRERDQFEESILVDRTTKSPKGKKITRRVTSNDNVRAKLVAACACKDLNDPTPLFTLDQVEQLGSIEAALLDPLFEVAARLSGITEADIGELAKN